jgi:site-specific DNA-methyltransferase (adenine-specific)
MSKTYIIGDCIEEMKHMEPKSVDLIYANLPFATTNKAWDKEIDLEILFREMYRILKEDGVIALHAAIPFTYKLISICKPQYHYTWVKARPTGHLNAKKQPLRNCEEVLIYYKNPKHTYFPQMTGDIQHTSKRENKQFTEYYRSQKSYSSSHVGNYPRTFLGVFKSVSQSDSPKSIPDSLISYFIKTYTKPGGIVIDPTCCDDGVG